MNEKRFKRYLLDGGFWFDEYIKPIWAIRDTINPDNPIKYIEFKDEYKDLCDEIITYLNEQHEENKKLKQDIIQIEKVSDKRYYDNQRLKTRLQEKDSLLQKILKTNENLQKALQKQYEEFDEK